MLLTRLPFVNLFYEMCGLIAPQYFDKGEQVLEAAFSNICQWPVLTAGDTLTLPLLGTVYQTFIPKVNSKSHEHLQHSTESNGHVEKSRFRPVMPPQVLSSVHEIDIFCSLFSVLSHIHLLWELVLTAEPIVVMGSSPANCSLMVQSLMR